MDTNKITALISLLDEEDQEVLNSVESEIRNIGIDIVPFLEREWENNFNPNVQKRIEELVHEIHFNVIPQRLIAWKNNTEQDILMGMWIVSTYLYPDLEYSKVENEILEIYEDVKNSIKEDMPDNEKITVLNHILFSQYKFSANTKNFHSPSNSMINVVLESKKGNPITLCVIYMYIAQKLNLPVYGVNLPNLFILTYKSNETQYYINAFNKGITFTKLDIDNYLNHSNITPRTIFYEPCSNEEIIKRVFRNLIVSFQKIGEHEKSDEIKKLLSLLAEDNY